MPVEDHDDGDGARRGDPRPNTLLLEGVLLGIGALYFLVVFPRLTLEPAE